MQAGSLEAIENKHGYLEVQLSMRINVEALGCVLLKKAGSFEAMLCSNRRKAQSCCGDDCSAPDAVLRSGLYLVTASLAWLDVQGEGIPSLEICAKAARATDDAQDTCAFSRCRTGCIAVRG